MFRKFHTVIIFHTKWRILPVGHVCYFQGRQLMDRITLILRSMKHTGSKGHLSANAFSHIAHLYWIFNAITPLPKIFFFIKCANGFYFYLVLQHNTYQKWGISCCDSAMWFDEGCFQTRHFLHGGRSNAIIFGYWVGYPWYFVAEYIREQAFLCGLLGQCMWSDSKLILLKTLKGVKGIRIY